MNKIEELEKKITNLQRVIYMILKDLEAKDNFFTVSNRTEIQKLLEE